MLKKADALSDLMIPSLRSEVDRLGCFSDAEIFCDKCIRRSGYRITIVSKFRRDEIYFEDDSHIGRCIDFQSIHRDLKNSLHFFTRPAKRRFDWGYDWDPQPSYWGCLERERRKIKFRKFGG